MSELLFGDDNPFLALFAGDGAVPDDEPNTGSDDIMPGVPWTMPKNIREGKMYHDDYAAAQDSLRGAQKAKAGGYDSIDRNMIKTSDNVYANTHWNDAIAKGRFYDPRGVFGPKYAVTLHTYEQSARLRTKEGYVIRTVAQRFREDKSLGLVTSLEPKGKNWTVNDFRILMQQAVAARQKVIVKSAYSSVKEAAAKAGFQTRYTRDHRPGM